MGSFFVTLYKPQNEMNNSSILSPPHTSHLSPPHHCHLSPIPPSPPPLPSLTESPLTPALELDSLWVRLDQEMSYTHVLCDRSVWGGV